MKGLSDITRPEKKAKYDRDTKRWILTQLDSAPLTSYATWTGGLLAKALRDVSPHQVWRVLHQHGIHFRHRRSWCVSTNPGFVQKAVDIVGL